MTSTATTTAFISPEPDLALLARYTQQGDADAFSVLVRRYTHLVYHACLRVLRDSARAEDAAQETFYRLMRRPESVTHSLPAWLHRAATNLAIDRLRSEASRRNRERSYQRLLEQRRKQPEQWSELSGQVDAALEALDEAHRVLLIEHFYAGRTQQDLAREHGVSKATMSRRMHAALEALRQRLGTTNGVAVTVAALTAALGETSASAAPVTLAVELSKMAMVSGTSTTASVAATATGTSAGVTAACGVASSAVLLGLGTLTGAALLGLIVAGVWVLVAGGPSAGAPGGYGDAAKLAVSSEGTSGEAGGAAVAVEGAGTDQGFGGGAAPDDAGDSGVVGASGGEAVSLEDAGYIFVQPADGRMGSDAIVMFRVAEGVAAMSYADSHLKSLPLAEARPLIEAQAGVTLEALARRQSGAAPPASP